MITYIYRLMMREKVCIVLNEREPAKQAAVSNLMEELKLSSITASRLEITDKIIELVCTRNPEVVVLDYLLGDFSTGLDIVYALNRLPKQPSIFFLTDEPSAQVAVEAMRAGAKNYYLLDRKDSVQKLSAEITTYLYRSKQTRIQTPRKKVLLADLIAQSEKSRHLISRARNALMRKAKIIFIYGPPGSGLSTLAEALHNELSASSYQEAIDIRFCDQTVAEIFGYPSTSKTKLRLGINASLILEHIEEDTGEITAFLSKYGDKLLQSGDHLLVLTSNDQNTLRICQKQLDLDVLTIPPLSERVDDILPLVQLFLHQAESVFDQKIKGFTASVIQALSAMSWDGNIRQLKSVILEAAAESTFNSGKIEDIIEQKRDYWIKTNVTEDAARIDPLTAARTLSIANSNYRIAAAKLGCSVPQLRTILENA